MPPLDAPATVKTYWRSLAEYADTPEFRAFVEAEFPALMPELLSSPSRRQFLKVMGASLALAGLTGCRWPKETIVPYAKRPAGRSPGVPVQYATAMELGGVATGLLVTSYDGRPIKVEGNDKHPFSQGKTNHLMQASILDLYDPDRSQRILQRTGGGARRARTWDEFAEFARRHFGNLREKRGTGLAVLSEASSSPSLIDMKARALTAFPQATWYKYEPLSGDNEREGARLAFGKPYRTHLNLDKADVIVSLGADLLMTHPAAVKYTRDFARRRTADDATMNRLYVFESNYTVTGSTADRRYAVRSSAIGSILERLAAAIPGANSHTQPTSAPVAEGAIAALADELVSHRGRCVMVAGPQQPAQVHALVHQLNAALGNVGTTIDYTDDPEPERPTHVEAIAALAERMKAGEVETLLILGGNPAYTAPADVEFTSALENVPTTIHLSLYDGETSRTCTWHLPRAHYLESWGDARAYDGTVSLIQPLIDPLYGGRTAIELLALAIDDELTIGYEVTRRTFQAQFAAGPVDFERVWEQALHDGVVADTAWPTRCPEPIAVQWEETASPSGFEVVFAPDYSVYDGRFANNGWLQELPDPITKLTWDNAALLAPADADELGVQTGDVVNIEHEGRSREMPAYVLPGHARGSITLPLGYGRRAGGRVADGAGFDAYALRTSEATEYLTGCKVSRTGRSYPLSTTQDHHAIASEVGEREKQRRLPQLAREATLEEYKHHPGFAQHVGHAPPVVPLWKEHEYRGHRWAMAIDLSKCTGCSACVVACQAENNVPVVGKQEVALGREMHWLRVDRYFKGEPDDPQVEIAHQPVTCHHCENAPCEQVCPVAATLHDQEGLNVQVYNRCVGTRYCSNNCPYKVRRFNWFYNHHGPKHPRSAGRRAKLTEIEKMLFNPEVTVRGRGVMEKCTFCTQRINAVKIAAKNERREMKDGEIVPACAQACPAEAIVFGDLNDPNSRVRKLHEHRRSYAMLEELYVKPRTKYLAKLRNPAGEAGVEHGNQKDRASEHAR